MANSEPDRTTSHPLMGADIYLLRRLRRRHGNWARAGRIFFSVMGRYPFTLIEKAVVATKRGKVTLKPPVFIIGHWRSGTTHLYNILSKAPEFQYVNPYQAGLPWDFITLSKLMPTVLEKSLPQGRFIDEVAVTPTSPQEDEFALANMMPHSFLHALYFPKDFFDTFNRGLFFEGLSAAEIGEWKERLIYFYTKLQMAGPDKTILIKNPPYTARVALLREMFPGAKFINIRRNPYKVFFSMRNFYQELLKELALEPYTLSDFDDHILATYVRMMEALERDTKGIPKTQYIDFDFADLQKRPLKTLRTIYSQLNLGDFEADKSYFENYLKSVQGYQKNVYDFPKADLKKVDIHWRKYIKAGGYKCP